MWRQTGGVIHKKRSEGNVLFNVAFNTFLFTVNIASDMLNVHSEEGRKEMFYVTTHSIHFIYGYMASDIW